MTKNQFQLTDEAKQEFVLEAYRQCFAAKHHYDNLSWIIGAPAFAVAGATLIFIGQIKSDDYCWQLASRLIVSGFSIGLLWVWHKIYERNRVWGEVANETARDIERANGLSGIGIEFMKRHWDGHVILKNTDELGEAYALEGQEPPKGSTKSIHLNIPKAIIIYAVASLASCFIPT